MSFLSLFRLFFLVIDALFRVHASEKADRASRVVSTNLSDRMEVVGGLMAADKSRTKEGLAELEALVDKVAKNDATLFEINLTGNATLALMERPNREKLLERLVQAIAKNTHVTSILLVNCGVEDASVVPLAKVLANNAVVVTLSLESNNVGAVRERGQTRTSRAHSACLFAPTDRPASSRLARCSRRTER